MLNHEQIMGNWNQIKGGVRNIWGQITDDELESTQGNLSAISGIVQQKYGESKETIKEKMDRLMRSFDNVTDKYHVDAKASYERNPTKERTSSTSQVQDTMRDYNTRSKEREKFDEDIFDASQEALKDPNGTSNNSYMNPNREKVDRESRQ